MGRTLTDIHADYDELSDILKRRYTPEEFARLTSPKLEAQRIQYSSDGLNVIGYIVKPKEPGGRKHPAIIYNRGGNRDYGKISYPTLLYLHKLAAYGFVVIASDYRGANGEGQDEFGGNDINDVLNLFPLAESLGYVDMENIFMMGVSRGGMMTYLAIKNGAKINAAAVVGGPTDIKEDDRQRPEMHAIYRQLWPDYETDPEQSYQRRSAYYWADKIDVPMLLIHGSEDDRVNPRQSVKMAEKLQSLNKPCQLILYRDNHTVDRNHQDRDRRIIDWFRSHMRKPANSTDEKIVHTLNYPMNIF